MHKTNMMPFIIKYFTISTTTMIYNGISYYYQIKNKTNQCKTIQQEFKWIKKDKGQFTLIMQQ